MQERYTQVMEKWFILEPPMFQVLCLHELVPNSGMACPMRSGKRKLEYNPLIVDEMSEIGFEEALRAEAVRLLLKHPYARRPEGCSQRAMGLGSNLVIGDNYDHPRLRMETPEQFSLRKGMNYEWYARMVDRMDDQVRDSRHNQDGDSPDGGVGGKREQEDKGPTDKHHDLAELWEEDELIVQEINGIISTVKNWGTLPGEFVEKILTSLKAKINWRTVFAGFRASIISSRRKLTRMKPNRRTGFQNMGSIRHFDTKLLVAVDVSGSISTKSLMYFYGVINSTFRYGIEAVDVIQFDCGIRGVQKLRKSIRETGVLGRGGTSFQEPVDYANEHGYDGLVILTDGYAPPPKFPDVYHPKVLWVCENEKCMEKNGSWMENSGRVCVMELD